jgi:16S rRNA (adenine(1408)-N(1))-methyltransferase
LPRTGEGIVIDIGTGDGRFVSAAARADPNKFFIGVDANVKPLEKPSMRATRKPAKGGLPNALFVQAAVEDLPAELDGVADEIHIHFPWGSLLKAVAAGDAGVLASLRRIAAPGCLLEVVIGIDPERDKAEIERLALPVLSAGYLDTVLVPKFEAAGFAPLRHGVLGPAEWPRLETSWARKLSGSEDRVVRYLIAKAV